MNTLENSRFLRALRRQSVDCTPVWIMRQAGRYLPEYRATRERAGSFMTLCRTPELACEVTLQPLRRFALDAAILFSDILTIPDAMGLGLGFVEGEGPVFAQPLRDARSIDALPQPDPEQDLGYVMDAVRLIRRELPTDLPLIGFAGSPWTLATYMVEGGGSREHRLVKTWLYDDPDSLHRLLAKLASAVADYLAAQCAAGVQAAMLFDTWGGILTTPQYHQFSLPYMQTIVAKLKAIASHVPVILFTKGGGQWLESMAATGCDALGLDWTCDLGQARRRVGDRVALQGNLDPAALYADTTKLRQAVAGVLDAYGPGSGHIFNLGHGITPGVDPARVTELVDAVHEFSAKRNG